MYELKVFDKKNGKIMGRMGLYDDEILVRECCEKGGLLLIEGRCYDCPVVVDGKGNRFAMIPREKNEVRWVELKILKKNKRLEKGDKKLDKVEQIANVSGLHQDICNYGFEKQISHCG